MQISSFLRKSQKALKSSNTVIKEMLTDPTLLEMFEEIRKNKLFRSFEQKKETETSLSYLINQINDFCKTPIGQLNKKPGEFSAQTREHFMSAFLIFLIEKQYVSGEW
mmetsp:Transcript_18480/g.21221  ORF Transcript_18480/g.21221 Transcript_18480/m.21221 type:complete len:108 (+) Transcript_18480:70-393(+)